MPAAPSTHLVASLLAIALLTATASAARALEPVWDRLPRGVPADSLAPALRVLETRSARPLAAAAAFALGQFHHARGEYRSAADAFARAAVRLTGFERAEARLEQGVSLLGAAEGARARAAFDEALRYAPPEAPSARALRAQAELGLARAFALTGETLRELDVLDRLLDGPAGEAEPAALERFAVLCEGVGREGDAASARDRLLRGWPRSFEAARLGRPAPPPGP